VGKSGCSLILSRNLHDETEETHEGPQDGRYSEQTLPEFMPETLALE
jgi:hypothetical protein